MRFLQPAQCTQYTCTFIALQSSRLTSSPPPPSASFSTLSQTPPASALLEEHPTSQVCGVTALSQSSHILHGYIP